MTSTTATAATKKISWKIFFDLQCPYAKRCWGNLPAIRARFEKEYDITTHLTSLAFHPQAFPAQSAATLIGTKLGPAARDRFMDACYTHQDRYTNDGLGDARKSDVDAVFADIAQQAGLFDETKELTREIFLANLHDWDTVVMVANKEHKMALGYGVFGTPKHVIDEKLVPDTESAWGPDEWETKLKSL